MFIDTHCHLDAVQFDANRAQIINNAISADVKSIVIPSVSTQNFDKVKSIAYSFDGGYYALGIHPFYLDDCDNDAINVLEQYINQNLQDPKFIAIGEIGLDFYEEKYKNPLIRQKQEYFFQEQIKLADKYKLPVILHIRKSHDRVLKTLRKYRNVSGIAHAFNASLQQAQVFIDLGFKLGAGGAITYQGSLRIRNLIKTLGAEHWVLETDAPYMLPAWLSNDDMNQPAEVKKIATEMATLLSISIESLSEITTNNAISVLRLNSFHG